MTDLITTEAQLDALPVGAVVRGEYGVFEKQLLSDGCGTIWAMAGDTYDYTAAEVIEDDTLAVLDDQTRPGPRA